MGGGEVQPQNPINSQQQQRDNHHQLPFQGNALGYSHALDSNPKAPDLGPARFLQQRCFPLNHQGANLFGEIPVRNWEDGRGRRDGSETDDYEDDLGDNEEEDGDGREGFAGFGGRSRNKTGRDGGCYDHNDNDSDAVKKDSGTKNGSSSSGMTVAGGMVKSGNLKTKICFPGKDANVVQAGELNGARATSGCKRRNSVMENSNCGFSGRKEFSSLSESGDSLRAILSDPVTGELMEDAMILPCGHSFGSGGMQQVIRTKACTTCLLPTLEDLILPNHALREAVQAFIREQSSKRRKEKLEQEKDGHNYSYAVDMLRGRGHYPFSVSDRVIIKGNKRTPDRFVGRLATVMAQCLNGWYVVKTLDDAECVKLQYRSLAKVTEGSS
ncbi:hypothetical protein MLD38_018839 [Melastoma candidum]|uniref:Uncharacterized protein n=1 Tax=Melastoma candidum TaxID=119954 RepID=A0ACB9QZ32_9MYRT|nr:hypothetical protein MLD38_018839 [Melastoma candidum]